MALNLAKIKENRKKAKEESSRRNANYFSFQPGRNIVRIMPPWEGADDFSRPMGKHWNLGPEGKTNVFCPKHTAGLPCPICEELDAIWKTKPDDATKEWLKNVGASQRYYVNLVDLNNLEEGVQIGELPKSVLEEIWNIMVDEDTGLGDITDWDEGFDLIIEKTGKGIGTRYSVRAKRSPTAISKAEYEPALVNLDSFVKTESYANLKLIYEGKTSESAGVLPAPAAEPVTTAISDARTVGSTETEPDVIEAESTDVTDLVDAGLPACFGGFNEDNAKCLDCLEQDDCEEKMEEEKAKAIAPSPAATRAPATTTAPTPAAEAAPAGGGGGGGDKEVDDLMAQLQDAIDIG